MKYLSILLMIIIGQKTWLNIDMIFPPNYIFSINVLTNTGELVAWVGELVSWVS